MTTNGIITQDDLEYIEATIDKRPEPKPRKHARLWQAYLIWSELVDIRKRHILRLTAIERGKSNMDADMEYYYLGQIDALVKEHRREMINFGEEVGPVWYWMTGIKGLGEGSLAAQVLAQIDDPAKFATISKLWAFSGYGVVDGWRQYNKPGEPAKYSNRLKSTVFLVGDQFIRQRTPVYRDIYDEEKVYLRQVYPEPIKENGKTRYNDGHIHAMARRKMVKIWLSHLWVVWREAEGLPVSAPYAQAILGHTNIIEPVQL